MVLVVGVPCTFRVFDLGPLLVNAVCMARRELDGFAMRSASKLENARLHIEHGLSLSCKLHLDNRTVVTSVRFVYRN